MGMRAFNNVEHGGQTNSKFCSHMRTKEVLDDVASMYVHDCEIPEKGHIINNEIGQQTKI